MLTQSSLLTIVNNILIHFRLGILARSTLSQQYIVWSTPITLFFRFCLCHIAKTIRHGNCRRAWKVFIDTYNRKKQFTVGIPAIMQLISH